MERNHLYNQSCDKTSALTERLGTMSSFPSRNNELCFDEVVNSN